MIEMIGIFFFFFSPGTLSDNLVFEFFGLCNGNGKMDMQKQFDFPGKGRRFLGFFSYCFVLTFVFD